MIKLIFFAFVAIGSVAAAQHTDRGVSSDEGYALVKAQTNTVIEDSSEFHRLKKRHGFYYQILGFGPNARNGTGLIYNYFFSRNDLLVLEYLTDAFSNYSSRHYNIKTSSFGVHYKKFTGNSFYFRVGLDQRFIDYNYNSIFLTPPESSAFKGTSTMLSFAIGNQWQWSNWSLGCDWIGTALPLLKSSSNESYSITSDNLARTNMELDQKIFATGSTPYALRFYAGYNF